MLLFGLNLIALKIVADSSLKCQNVFDPITVQALKEYKGISCDLAINRLVVFLSFDKKKTH